MESDKPGAPKQEGKMLLSLADLKGLASTAERNGTQHAFQAVALEWCGKAQAEIERLRAMLAAAPQPAEAAQPVAPIIAARYRNSPTGRWTYTDHDIGDGFECDESLRATAAAQPVAPIIAARYRNSPTGPWCYTDRDIGSIEWGGWREVTYLCDANAAPQPAEAAQPVQRNNPLSALAIRLLVEAGHVSQEQADEAFGVACRAVEAEAQRMNVSLPWVVAAPQQPAPEPVARVPLTEKQMLDCVCSVGTPAPMGLTRDRGPYEVAEPQWFLIQLVRSVERAHGIAAAPQPPEAAQPQQPVPEPVDLQALNVAIADALMQERERLCAAIKAEDDYTVTQGDYMLDSDDCISVIRGTWKRPEFAAAPQPPEAAQPQQPTPY